MSIVVMGGAGFIGRRMIPLLAAAGHNITCMDIDVSGARAAFARCGDKVIAASYDGAIYLVRVDDLTVAQALRGMTQRSAAAYA